jgi:1-aminocyclopropane-1-carboxylate deaminase
MIVGLPPVNTESINLPFLAGAGVQLTVARLDKMHPLISGNKWFKLKEYLKNALALHQSTLITFGGPYSNHIHATAAACRLCGLKAVGLIRGEQPATPSPTLTDAANLGMELIYLSRETYRTRSVPPFVLEHYPNALIVPEGGYGHLGAQGASAILQEVKAAGYSHILAAVGTGTTLAGLTLAAGHHQHVIGISVLKNHLSAHLEINDLLPAEKQHRFTLLHNYSFGGYAKHTPALLAFMNDWYRHTNIPTDFVYTGKLFFAVKDLVEKQYFEQGSRLLVIHSGGLQGNRSLPKGSLIF